LEKKIVTVKLFEIVAGKGMEASLKQNNEEATTHCPALGHG